MLFLSFVKTWKSVCKVEEILSSSAYSLVQWAIASRPQLSPSALLTSPFPYYVGFFFLFHLIRGRSYKLFCENIDLHNKDDLWAAYSSLSGLLEI